MQYKQTEKSSPEIGEELNVNYLLEGSTQRYKDQVRIRVQLIQSSTDDHIWGDVFEGGRQLSAISLFFSATYRQPLRRQRITIE